MMNNKVNAKEKAPVRVRFAPSPTGLTHLGSARTAMYNYLLAKQTGGQFILRFEDTDQKRYDPAAEQDLISSLKWLGLEWDEGPDIDGPYGPYRQLERKEKYQEYANKLIEIGKAYRCFCTREELNAAREEQQKSKHRPKYSGKCRDLSAEVIEEKMAAGEEFVIRFKMPKEGNIKVYDRLRGEIVFENSNLDDYVLVKSDGLALYHLAAMVDDHLMKITHVFRGEEWIPTFPLHAHIYRSFGWDEPEWVHLSLFLKPSGKGKMSKRDTEEMRLTGKTIFIKDMIEMGYLPEGVINWIALMGWSYDDKTEFFTLDDLVKKFSIEKLSPKNAAIDFKKFDHFNGLHMRAMSVEELANRLLPYYLEAGIEVGIADLLPIAPLIQPRIATLDEGPEWTAFFFKDNVIPDAESLIAKKLDGVQSLMILEKVAELLQPMDELSHETIEMPLRDLAEKLEVKAGQLFSILRSAVTGQKVSPPLLESIEILGKERVMKQIYQGIEILKNYNGTL
jgi:glutamyl-tRNA synthetase